MLDLGYSTGAIAQQIAQQIAGLILRLQFTIESAAIYSFLAQEVAMAWIAGGLEEVAWAKDLVAKAKTTDGLRHAQSILLPLEMGLSLEQAALAIGRSVSLICKLRNLKRREMAGEIEPKRNKTELRNRAALTLEKEAAILDALLTGAESGCIVAIPLQLPAFEKALGKPVALSTLYRIFARHGWRKLSTDTQHPQGDPARREAGKKLPDALAKTLTSFPELRPVRLML